MWGGSPDAVSKLEQMACYAVCWERRRLAGRAKQIGYLFHIRHNLCAKSNGCSLMEHFAGETPALPANHELSVLAILFARC